MIVFILTPCPFTLTPSSLHFVSAPSIHQAIPLVGDSFFTMQLRDGLQVIGPAFLVAVGFPSYLGCDYNLAAPDEQMTKYQE